MWVWGELPSVSIPTFLTGGSWGLNQVIPKIPKFQVQPPVILRDFKRPRRTHALFGVVVWLPLWGGWYAQHAKGREKPGLLREARCPRAGRGRVQRAPHGGSGPLQSGLAVASGGTSGDCEHARASASLVPENLQEVSQRDLA